MRIRMLEKEYNQCMAKETDQKPEYKAIQNDKGIDQRLQMISNSDLKTAVYRSEIEKKQEKEQERQSRRDQGL